MPQATLTCPAREGQLHSAHEVFQESGQPPGGKIMSEGTRPI